MNFTSDKQILQNLAQINSVETNKLRKEMRETIKRGGTVLIKDFEQNSQLTEVHESGFEFANIRDFNFWYRRNIH
ncbi:MAG: hypothetical protein NT007_00205 [Candidatus Kapabacteria bacterium]|nr:hypothetical protein [Candidatus Kapabacteria bacterium]